MEAVGSEAAAAEYYTMREGNPGLTYIDYLLQQQFDAMADLMLEKLT